MKAQTNPEFDSPFALENEIFSTSPLYLTVTAPDASVGGFGRISRIFYVKVNSDAVNEGLDEFRAFFPVKVDSARPQEAEQLVEVPTIASVSSLQQQTAEQIIKIPVPGRGGGGGRGGLQGISSGQNSTARLVEQTVDIPVPRGDLPLLLAGVAPPGEFIPWAS